MVQRELNKENYGMRECLGSCMIFRDGAQRFIHSVRAALGGGRDDAGLPVLSAILFDIARKIAPQRTLTGDTLLVPAKGKLKLISNGGASKPTLV